MLAWSAQQFFQKSDAEKAGGTGEERTAAVFRSLAPVTASFPRVQQGLELRPHSSSRLVRAAASITSPESALSWSVLLLRQKRAAECS
ncbi:MAG: hypothetical protein IPM93_21725 [Candidatus Obscuribacter sp.]|nr:hypothetical protein [Candidatus Obscuribacter sp.]